MPDEGVSARAATAPKPSTAACRFDDAFREAARGAVVELRGRGTPGDPHLERLEETIGAGLVARDCGKVRDALEELRRYVRAPLR